MPLRFDSDLVVSVDGLEGRVVGEGHPPGRNQ